MVDAPLTAALRTPASGGLAPTLDAIRKLPADMRQIIWEEKVKQFVSRGDFGSACSGPADLASPRSPLLTALAALQEKIREVSFSSPLPPVDHLRKELSQVAAALDSAPLIEGLPLVVGFTTSHSALPYLESICLQNRGATASALPLCQIATLCNQILEFCVARGSSADLAAEPTAIEICNLILDSVIQLNSALAKPASSSCPFDDVVRSWRDYDSARNVCMVLSYALAVIQQQSESHADVSPSRFGPELFAVLESATFPALMKLKNKPIHEDSNHASFSILSGVIRPALACLVRQVVLLNSGDYSAQLALGDDYYRAHSYEQALKLYLGAGCLESGFWTEVGMPDGFNVVLKRVIVCLKQTKSFAAAAILCQFVSPPDFQESLKLIQEHLYLFENNNMLLHFVWELPLLELLAHRFHKKGLAHLAQLVVAIIGKPEMNELSIPNIRKKMIYSQKKHFLLLLSREVSAGTSFVL